MFLYTNRNEEWVKIPSRSIEDVELPEDAYKSDFELGKRYQEFSKELVRFSLLGLAGYGFLIKEILGEKHRGMLAGGPAFIIMIGGVVCLACSAGLGLYGEELNAGCLRMQLVILRLLQRLGAERWTSPASATPAEVNEWREANAADLKTMRRHQKQNLTRAYHVLRITLWLLVLGIVLTAVEFLICLQSSTT